MAKTTGYTADFIKKRQFYTMLPIIVVPFLTFLFWTLGGGTGGTQTQDIGFNTELPDAKVNPLTNVSKEDIYAEQDQIKSSDTFNPIDLGQVSDSSRGDFDPNDNVYGNPLLAQNQDGSVYDPNEKTADKYKNYNPSYKKPLPPLNTSKTNENKIYSESVYKRKAGDSYTPDPEEEKKVDDFIAQYKKDYLQKDKKEENSSWLSSASGIFTGSSGKNNGQTGLPPLSNNVANAIKVSRLKMLQQDKEAITTICKTSRDTKRFYNDCNTNKKSKNQNIIKAVTHQTQIIVSGSRVKLRILDDVIIDDQVVLEKGNFIYAIASISGDRVFLNINDLKVDNELFTVAMSGYDIDGLRGLYIKDGIEKEMTKQIAANSINAVSSADFSGYGNVLVAPPNNFKELMSRAGSRLMNGVINASIEGVKGLAMRKVLITKATLKANSNVLLKLNDSYTPPSNNQILNPNMNGQNNSVNPYTGSTSYENQQNGFYGNSGMNGIPMNSVNSSISEINNAIGNIRPR